MTERLATTLAGLKLANPTMLASGILGYTGLSLKTVINAGAGAVVTKSMGLEARTGYPNPTVVQTDCGLLNSMGLPNPGITHFKEEMKQLKSTGVPIILSIYGYSAKDFVEVVKSAAGMGADAVELNVSCPHVRKAGAEIGCDPILLTEIVKQVKKAVNVTMIVKLTPNVANISEIARAAEKAGADAITAINTVKAMSIEIETARPLLANKFGGLSGPAIKPIAVRCIYDIYKSVDIPVIGCGGVTSWQDAVEFILCGSTAVNVGTANFVNPNAAAEVAQGLRGYLKRKGIKDIRSLVGSLRT